MISSDQSGFVKGRFIGENTRLLYDVMNYTEKHKLPGLLLMIDFEKAFDTLSFKFIKETLSFFNFGPMFKKWISLFAKNIKTAVQLNGFLSNFFEIERGCRQGDPISPYIFILCAEILAIKIRSSTDIKGFFINNVEYKISQFADDTSLLLDGSDSSLNKTLDVLHKFSIISGLKVNFDKTHVIWLGIHKYSTRSIKTKWKLKWGGTSFKLLGIQFHVDLDKMISINFTEKNDRIKNSIKFWDRRELTPIGRITVVKSILLPLLTHLFMSLPNPNIQVLQEINKIFHDFVWGGRPKIKSSVFIKEFKDGGLKMIDTVSYMKSLKLTWFRRLLIGSDKKCFTFVNNLFNYDKIFMFGKCYLEGECKMLFNYFWKDVLLAYSDFIDNMKITTIEQFVNCPLFYNNNILIDRKPVFIKTMYENGFYFISDIMNNNGHFISIENLNTRLGTNIIFLLFEGLKKL